MRILVSGSSGLVGSNLVPVLAKDGHEVVPLLRRPPRSGESGVVWDPKEPLAPESVNGFDAVVHLAGKGIADGRWTEQTKAEIRESRVRGTRVLAEALAAASSPPTTLLSASAMGFYGDRGDEWLNEDSAPGSGFLADVARDWESSTQPASDAGIRVCLMRFGMILSAKGGALRQMLPVFKGGFGGVVGDGRQYWSWVSADEAVSVIRFLLSTPDISGPVNVGAPDPVQNREFTRVLGRVLSRPTVLPTPKFAARLALGEMADALLLSSARMSPSRLVDAGYHFEDSDLEATLRRLLK